MNMQMKNICITISCVLILGLLISGCSERLQDNLTKPISQADYRFLYFQYRITQSMKHVTTTSSGLGGDTWVENATQRNNVECWGYITGNTFEASGCVSLEGDSDIELVSATFEWNKERTAITKFSFTVKDSSEIIATSTNSKTTYTNIKSISGGGIDILPNYSYKEIEYWVRNEETCDFVSGSNYSYTSKTEYKASDGSNQWRMTTSNSQSPLCVEVSHIGIRFSIEEKRSW